MKHCLPYVMIFAFWSIGEVSFAQVHGFIFEKSRFENSERCSVVRAETGEVVTHLPTATACRQLPMSNSGRVTQTCVERKRPYNLDDKLDWGLQVKRPNLEMLSAVRELYVYWLNPEQSTCGLFGQPANPEFLAAVPTSFCQRFASDSFLASCRSLIPIEYIGKGTCTAKGC